MAEREAAAMEVEDWGVGLEEAGSAEAETAAVEMAACLVENSVGAKWVEADLAVTEEEAS